MSKFLKLVLIGALATTASARFAHACDDCWDPTLKFDIEGKGFEPSLIFISGQSYSYSATNNELSRLGRNNFFCKKGSIGSDLLIEILNKELSGNVTPEMVTQAIVAGLKARFPCPQKSIEPEHSRPTQS